MVVALKDRGPTRAVAFLGGGGHNQSAEIQEGRSQENKLSDLTVLPSSDLLLSFLLTDPNWSPMAGKPSGAVYVGQTPDEEQDGEE